jgi:antitoxin component YwqK of YwqJK toxin-antitoxin module
MEILPSGFKIVMTLENYKNGKLEGLRSVYYPSGKIAEEISYLNNIKTVFTRVF